MRSNGNLMLGITIVVVGVLFFLEARGMFGNAFSEYWPGLLILLGAVSWATQGRKPSFANLVVIGLGIIFLLGNWNAMQFGWPLLIIIVGINLVIGPKGRDKFLR
jgi:lysylphosphatidylglycerol synthetase-like protein (DUF2156 family)